MLILVGDLQAIIDDEDYQLVSQYKWYPVTTRGLTYAHIIHPTRYMHRLILGATKGQYVDHINRNGLDNRRENLRITSQGVNIANAKMFGNNTSGYKGVVKYRTGWKAQIKYKQGMVQSNQINDVVAAALLRDELARRLFGDDVYINIPYTPPSVWAYDEAERLITNQGLS